MLIQLPKRGKWKRNGDYAKVEIMFEASVFGMKEKTGVPGENNLLQAN